MIIKHFIYSIILLATDRPTIWEKFILSMKVVVALAPVAYVLNGLGVWFQSNHMFFSFMLYIIFANMVLGALYHHKANKFSWSEFWKSNIKMWAIIILIYPMLEMLSIIAGNNFAGESFKIVIQISTMLYPGAKILKNVYLWSDKKYPPSWIIDRIYKFETTGKLSDLTKKDGEE
jgi:hypothetical protein